MSTDLSYFGGIVACGIAEAPMTSVAELAGTSPSLPEIAELVQSHFLDVFQRCEGEQIDGSRVPPVGAGISSGGDGT